MCHGDVIAEYLNRGFVTVLSDIRDGQEMRGEKITW
jgi:hypothetical protein